MSRLKWLVEMTYFYSSYNLPCNIMTSFKSIKVECRALLQWFRQRNPVNFICYSAKGHSQAKFRPACIDEQFCSPNHLSRQGMGIYLHLPGIPKMLSRGVGWVCRDIYKLKAKENLVMCKNTALTCLRRKNHDLNIRQEEYQI